MTWRRERACRFADTSVFYPTGKPGGTDRGGSPPDWGPARSYCDRCAVKMECLADEMQYEGYGYRGPKWRNGMFGGLQPYERDALTKPQVERMLNSERARRGV